MIPIHLVGLLRSAGEIKSARSPSAHVVAIRAASPDGGIAAPIFWGTALLDAGGCLDHLEIFLGRNVVSFVRDQVDKIAASALLGPVHQQLQFLLAGLPSRSLGGELLAVEELILAGISEHGEGIFERRRRARSQECGEN